MAHEALKLGQSLHSVWSLPHGEYGETEGATVGYMATTAIIVGRLAGPMGWYSTAEIYEGDTLARIHPLMHMATIVVQEPEKPF